MRNSTKKFGFITLTSVIIVGTIAVVIAVSMLLISATVTKSNQASIDMNMGKGIADACAETALGVIQQNVNYTGTNSLTIGGGSCTYTVTAQTGQNRTIAITSAKANISRKITILINQLSPQISVSSWQEN